jgi:aryl-alcohol dehydrogenase-like predicted oxidoreductase
MPPWLVDHLDLIQLHNLVEDDEWDRAHGPGGAVEAMVQARDEGLVRHIGVTGHGLRIAGMHRRSLEAFSFDSVLLHYSPILLRDEEYRSDVEALRALCAERGVAVQTIKAVERAVGFVLATPDLFLNTSSDATLLGHALEVANRLGGTVAAPSAEELDADIARLGMEPIFDGDVLERI